MNVQAPTEHGRRDSDLRKPDDDARRPESPTMRLIEHQAGCGTCAEDPRHCEEAAELTYAMLDAEECVLLEPARAAKGEVRVISEPEMLRESDEYGGGE